MNCKFAAYYFQMSLVVARKDGNKICIVSDTKLTYPNHESKRLKTSPTDGIIKTIILNNHLSISFAGEIETAELAFKEITHTTDTIFIVETLNEFHQKSILQTEFLICTGEPDITIYEIKNGSITKGNSGWIGDKTAFDKFQAAMLTPRKQTETTQTNNNYKLSVDTKKSGILITQMNLNIEQNHDSSLLSNISSAMDHVIDSGNIDSVGGFKVNVFYNGKFFYNGYVSNHRANLKLLGSGAHVIGHGTATDGSYSINFVGGSSDYQSVALHVKQGNFGIVYNRIDFGLLYPRVVHLDEVDFFDYIQQNFSIVANVGTQDQVQKFFNKAVYYFNVKNFNQSEHFFNKAFEAAIGPERAKILFDKGCILFRLNDKHPAMCAFNQAVKLDPSYTKKIINILHPRT